MISSEGFFWWLLLPSAIHLFLNPSSNGLFKETLRGCRTEVNPPRITAKLVFSLRMLLSCFKQALRLPSPPRGAHQTLQSFGIHLAFLLGGADNSVLVFNFEALLGGVPMSSVWISQLAMSQFRNILVSPVGISFINFSLLPLWQSPFAGTTPTEHTASIVSTFKLRVLRPFLMFNTYSDYFPTYPIEQFGNRTQSNTNRSIAELNRT